ncbi:MAG TPA: TetR family transcriptional regulator [Epsilonproteobacteria bacterium]|nr:TetR family transcriptional regulator [Campylobacterota bacterium]
MEKINIEKFNTLSQRQKKYAKTKTALLNALLEELESKKLSEIMIKSLAQKAEVSEPTFFNYFDSKSDMLVYFIQMWSIEMQTIAIECEKESISYVETIKNIFVKTATQISEHPQIMREIIAFQAQHDITKTHKVSNAEKWFFFQEIEGVEGLEGLGLESILPPLIAKAIETGEIYSDMDAELLFLMLSSLFFGTSLLVLKRIPEHLPMMLETELNLFFERITYVKS